MGRQDVILAKMGGKAKETNVAAGMSGSPVYIDGKLVGAVALRISVFSPDAICGITPIELMLEIKDFDKSRPTDARTPDKAVASAPRPSKSPANCWASWLPRARQHLAAARSADDADRHAAGAFRILRSTRSTRFDPLFQQMGITAVQGGAGAADLTAKPARDGSIR